MQPLIPLPDALTSDGRSRALTSPVTIHGPDWVDAVINALPAHFPFPAAVRADCRSATVTIVALNAAAHHQADSPAPWNFPDASYRIEITDDRIEIACPKCRVRMREEGLTDGDELQSYLVRRAVHMLRTRGRVAIGWDEILDGGLPDGTIVMSWRGVDGGCPAAAAGNEAIMAPVTPCYFNMTHAARGPGDIAVSVRDVYAFDPVSAFNATTVGRVLGGQACIWTEYIETEEKAQRMPMPRLLAMSEALWSAPNTRDFTAFRSRARAWLRRFETSGWSVTNLDDA